MKYISGLIALLLALLGMFVPVQAQRCLPRQAGLQFSGGTVDGYIGQSAKEPAFFASIGLASYTRNGSYWTGGADYLQKNYFYRNITIPLAQFTVEGGYYHSLFSNRGKDFFVLAGLAGVAGYETVNWNETLLFDGAAIQNDDAFLYGFSAGYSIEVYLSDKVVWLFNLKERILFGSPVSKFHTLIGIGIRVVLN